MKLVMTIISNSDVEKVLDAVSKNGYQSTKISTAGQFLVDGHTTFFTVTDDEKVERLYEIIKESVTKRKIKTPGVTSTISGSLLNQAVDVEEYGAVAFTINVEDFRKL